MREQTLIQPLRFFSIRDAFDFDSMGNPELEWDDYDPRQFGWERCAVVSCAMYYEGFPQ